MANIAFKDGKALGLTDRELEILSKAWRCMKSTPEAGDVILCPLSSLFNHILWHPHPWIRFIVRALLHYAALPVWHLASHPPHRNVTDTCGPKH